MKLLLKKCTVVLGLIFFFALFLPIGKVDVHAKETTLTDIEPTVAETQAEIKLGVKSKYLVKGKEYTLKVYNLTEKQKVVFRTSDSEIATVNEDGVIHGIANGTATITVLVKEGSKVVSALSCTVVVGPPAINVKWTKSEVVLLVGKKTTLKTIVLPYNTVETAKFFTANKKVATVSSTGKVTAKALGTTYLFTMIDNGKFDICKVTVVDEKSYQMLLENPDSLYETSVPLDEEETNDNSMDFDSVLPDLKLSPEISELLGLTTNANN